MDVVLSNTDRFIRNFVAVVDGDKPEREIENVHATTYSSRRRRDPGHGAAQADPHLSRRDHRARRGRPGHADDCSASRPARSGW